jgi:RimJ/RimL family protein N-acetyltransferase
MEATHTLFQIRPVTRKDRARFADMFERLSRHSRYQRFLHPKPRLSDEELEFFTDVDHVRHEALAAIDPADGSFVGVARYAVLGGDTETADLAFEVVDEWQGRRVGTTLVRALLERAAQNGVSDFIALTLSDNAPARKLLKRVGFRIVDSSHGVVELRREDESAALQLVA